MTWSGGRAARRRRRSDTGMAVVEFLFACLVLVVPIVYVMTLVDRIHTTAVTADSAAAGTALAIARGTSPPAAADRLVAGYWREAGLADPFRATVRCEPVACLRSGGLVTVQVRATVAAPLVPADLVSVPVAVQRTQVVDRFSAAGNAS